MKQAERSKMSSFVQQTVSTMSNVGYIGILKRHTSVSARGNFSKDKITFLFRS